MYIKKNNILLKISGYLFILIPFLLITGPFLSDLALSIIVILFFIIIYKEKKFEIFKSNFFKIFFFFYIYLVLNSFIQNQNFDSIKISLSYFRFGIFVLATIYILKNENKILKKLYYLFLIIFSILILDGFIQFLEGKNILGYPLVNGIRVTSFFNDESILGSYLSRLFPIFFGLQIYFHKELNKFQYFLSYILFIFAEVIIYLSGERAAFLFMNLSAVFIIMALKNFRKLRIITLLSSLTLIILISIIYPNTKQRVINQTLDQIGFGKDKKIVFFSHQHNELYKTAINIFRDNIYIGVGVKNFRNQCNLEKYKISEFSCSTHPHNSYIQLITELGLVGLIFGIFVIITYTKHIFLHFKYKLNNKNYFNDFQICLLSSILITLWPLVPTGNLFNNWLNIVYYYPVGILLWSLDKKSLHIKNSLKSIKKF